MLIQFHILQNYAPSNLNRDDTGSPKDAVFGGVLRGRISSQCLKRSIRYSEPFKTLDKDGLLGKRTQTLPALLQQQLAAMGLASGETTAILSRLPEIIRGGKDKPQPDQNTEGEIEPADDEDAAPTPAEDSKQLIFLDVHEELGLFATKMHNAYQRIGPAKWGNAKPKEIAKFLGESLPRSLDIAMFGRMTTSAAFKDVQAAVQVAHALSTNALKQEFDYYTAVDDLKPEGEPGADMIGDVEYNSCTYYKYLNVHWEDLVTSLGGDVAVAKRGVLALLEAAATAQPSGKQNSFGAFNLPDFIMVEVSDRNLPISYANAFLKPVKGFDNRSLMEGSVEALSEYVGKLSKVYDLTPQRRHLSVEGKAFLDAKPESSLKSLGAWLSDQLPK
jgi:CRISPR system Cascade subunit CasC